MTEEMTTVSKDELEMLRHYHSCIPILIQGVQELKNVDAAYFRGCEILREWDVARQVYHD